MKSIQGCTFIISIFFLISNCSPKHNYQIRQNTGLLSETVIKNNFTFPTDWLGYWTGDLKIYDSNGLKQVVPMALDLSKTDSLGIFTWAIIYGQDSTAQRRNYQLIPLDSTAGHYIIDEKNGILLDAYHIQNELTSIFEVMGNTIITTYTLNNDQMIFSVKMFPSKEISVSGDTIINNEEIPKVKSYKLAINQIAKLDKKCLVE